MEKDSTSATSSDTTINLSSVKEVVSKSSKKLVQSVVSSKQSVEIGQGELDSLKLTCGEITGDVAVPTKDDNAIASNLANQISSFKIDHGIDGINAKEAFSLAQMEQNVSASSIKQSTKSSIVNMQSSSVVDASVTIKLEKHVESKPEETVVVVKTVEVKQESAEEKEVVNEKVEENGDETESETDEEVEEIVIEEIIEDPEKVVETKQKTDSSEVIEKTPSSVKSEVKLEDVKDEPDEVEAVPSSVTDETDTNEEKEEKNEDVSNASNTSKPSDSASESVDNSSKDNKNEVEIEDGGEEIEVSAEASSASEVDTAENKQVAEEPKKPEPETKPAPATAVNELAKHENINNTLREIISDIDTNIKEDEAILQLKKEEQNLLKKHEELTKCIEEQQQLARKLAAENQIKLEELNKQQAMQQAIQQQQQKQLQQQQRESARVDFYNNSSVRTETTKLQSNQAYSAPISQSYNEPKDFSGQKQIDLNKIFTPATDSEELCQKNRKLYASSAFYSPSLHPTVEDQVELARRISHSLSDISNQTSKGQSMYDNRKKRSVKWVHESIGQGATEANDFNDNEESQTRSHIDKIPLRLVMNPRGHVIDFNSVQETVNTKTGLLSPDRCAELVHALQTQKGKGAELFAKRRKKSDKWIIDETNAGTQSPSGIPDNNQVPTIKSPVSPSILPAYSEAGKHRVQLNMHQQQLLEKYGQPSLTVVKTPWEAALETGSASTAFVEDHTCKPLSPLPQSFSPQPTSQNFTQSNNRNNEADSYLSRQPATRQGPVVSNPQRDLAYKPSVAQGWNAPTVTLPKQQAENYMEQKHASNETLKTTMDYMTHNSSMNNQAYVGSVVDITHEHTDMTKNIVREFQRDENDNISTETNEHFKDHIDKNNSEIASPKTDEEEYTRLPVRDLIQTFEINENSKLVDDNSKKLRKSIENKSSRCSNMISQVDEDDLKSNSINKDMFVPKEIPLENYAPPPVVPGIQTPRPVLGNTGSNFPSSFKQQPNVFPRNTQWQPTYLQNTTAEPVAQKAAPQVNFNPSPLSHEKLSKFENKSEVTNYGASLTDYNPNTARTYNTSPAPFGTPAYSPNFAQNNWNVNNNNEIRKPVVQQPNRIYQKNTTFNNSARGWGCGNNYGCSSVNQHTSNFSRKMGPTTALPYTDF